MRSGFVRLLLASPRRKLTEEHRSVQLDRRSRICPCPTAMIAAGRPKLPGRAMPIYGLQEAYRSIEMVLRGMGRCFQTRRTNSDVPLACIRGNARCFGRPTL